MERAHDAGQRKHARDLLREIGSVHDGKTLSNKHRVTTSESDPMAKELRKMSLDCKTNDTPHTDATRHWIAIDRSMVVGVGRPWDGVAYVGTAESQRKKRHEKQQTQPGSKKSSSLNVERGTIV